MFRFVSSTLLCAVCAWAQLSSGDLKPALDAELLTPEAATLLLRQYLIRHAPQLTVPATAVEWQAESERIRAHVLNDVIYHGWPRTWIDMPPHFEELGVIETGHEYRIRKLRYEIVPGFYSTALLYEPKRLSGRVPAVLNVNGHCGAPPDQAVTDYPGKAFEYKQKRCINMALRGMIALNLEWIGCGELFTAGNNHRYAAHLDLIGDAGVGAFYLAMRRGLDYLAAHPHVDAARIGMTGMSGGGWQTIMLGALDPRVNVAVPVAGYSAYVSRVERLMDLGDNEQLPPDIFLGQDFTHLTAMRAPHPTLLIYNAADPCCYRGPLVQHDLYDRVAPFFALTGAPGNLAWHLNLDPGTHNYQLDNRLAAYRFFATHFSLRVPDSEIPTGADVRSYEELRVGLPQTNLTLLDLARRLASELPRRTLSGEAARRQLTATLRYTDTTLAHAWLADGAIARGISNRAYRFEFANGLPATGLWVTATATSVTAPVAIVLNDAGRSHAEKAIAEHVNRGEQVLALDPLFTGDAAARGAHGDDQRWLWAIMVSATGARPLGLEAAQVNAVAGWLAATTGQQTIELDTAGIRSHVIALAAAAMAPGRYSTLTFEHGLSSFAHLLDAPVAFDAAPDLFCRDLYRDFDIDSLTALSAPLRVRAAAR